MRQLLILLVIAVLTLSSCAAAASRTTTDIMANAVSALETVPFGTVYFCGAERYSSGELAPALAGYMYYGKYEINASFSLLEDYAIRLSDRTEMCEIHILKAKSRSDTAVLMEMLESRLRILSGSDLESYDYRISHDLIGSAELFSKGNYAIMLITSDNAAVKKAILDCIG